MQSKATSIAAYLAELPDERRQAIEAVRAVIRKNLDAGFEEGIQYGMIGYFVPHSLYPSGYHCDPRQPLPFAALASQKNYMSLYLMSVYSESNQRKQFEAAWAKSGKKLNMGKACIRFRKLEDVALDAIGEAIRRVTAKGYIDVCERILKDRPQKAKPARKKVSSSRAKKATKANSRPRRQKTAQ